ncbi:MAG TPA: lysine--tRNA ligase [Candidatus Paceibacterota bacterium]
MASLEEIRQERLKKLSLLKKAGIDPYPAQVADSLEISKILADFTALEEASSTVSIAGRIMAMRGQGGLVFADIYDGTSTMQAVIKADNLSADSFELFQNTLDVGDFVHVTGVAFTTKRGEKSLEINNWTILSKSLRSLPEKWHGLKDEEERLRKRYLDILTNEEVKDVVIKRSIFWSSIRNFLSDRGFLEVDTPVLENLAGGAEAEPFVTHHNALDLDLFLRISPELWLKRLMVAGLPKVFEIGRVFRNEGMDAEHLQDYTAVEWYWAYADYHEGMKLVKAMFQHIARATFGTTKFKIKEFEIDLADTWETYDYVSTILEKTGVNVLTADLTEMMAKIDSLGIKYDKNGFSRNRAVDTLWKYCRRQIAGPGFLINVPVFMEPLAKKKADNPEVVERFQVLLAGSEMGKGFSELNDPIDQAERFDDQSKLRAAGDKEAQMYDTDFVEAMEYGMPPCSGFGVSERLFSFLSNKTVRETQIFPLMRPKNQD